MHQIQRFDTFDLVVTVILIIILLIDMIIGYKTKNKQPGLEQFNVFKFIVQVLFNFSIY